MSVLVPDVLHRLERRRGESRERDKALNLQIVCLESNGSSAESSRSFEGHRQLCHLPLWFDCGRIITPGASSSHNSMMNQLLHMDINSMIGSCMPLSSMRIGTIIHNIEVNLSQGGKLV